MSLAIQGSTQSGALMIGMNGRTIQWGTFKFNAADATGSLKLLLSKLEALFITPAGTPAADEQVSGPAIPADGKMIDGTGAVTVTRTGAAKTANLVCSYLAIGW